MGFGPASGTGNTGQWQSAAVSIPTATTKRGSARIRQLWPLRHAGTPCWLPSMIPDPPVGPANTCFCTTTSDDCVYVCLFSSHPTKLHGICHTHCNVPYSTYHAYYLWLRLLLLSANPPQSFSNRWITHGDLSRVLWRDDVHFESGSIFFIHSLVPEPSLAPTHGSLRYIIVHIAHAMYWRPPRSLDLAVEQVADGSRRLVDCT